MTAETPRRATFDDLRVGQWVAWWNREHDRPRSDCAGRSLGTSRGGNWLEIRDGSRHGRHHRATYERGEVTHPPRRSCAPGDRAPRGLRRTCGCVRAALMPLALERHDAVLDAVRALIDNAEGADQ